MNYTATIEVNKEESEKMEQILAIEEGHCPDYDRIATIKTYTAKFPNGFESDVKVCNGDTPYVDAVLFDEDGVELCTEEVSETLLGEYAFTFEADSYEVTVKIAE